MLFLLFIPTGIAQQTQNEPIEEILKPIIQKAIVIAEKTGDFIIEQAPLVLQEFYLWHTATSIFYIILGLFFIISGIYIPILWINSYNAENGKNYDYKYFNFGYGDGCVVIAWVYFAISSLIGIITVFVNIYTLVFILVAPKLYLIEYFLTPTSSCIK